MSPRDEGTDINDMMNIECGITLLSENEVLLVLQQQWVNMHSKVSEAGPATIISSAMGARVWICLILSSSFVDARSFNPL